MATHVILLALIGLNSVCWFPQTEAKSGTSDPNGSFRLQLESASTHMPFISKPSVAKELGLSDEQKQRLALAFDLMRPERRALWSAMFEDTLFMDATGQPRPSDDVVAEMKKRAGEGSKRLEEIHKKRAALVMKEQEAIKSIFDPAQYGRYKQLELQSAMPLVFARSEIADKLELTEEQRSRISAIRRKLLGLDKQEELRRMPLQDRLRAMEEEFEENHRIYRLRGEDRRKAKEERADKQRKPKAEAITEILGLLTPEQKETWDELIGRPFDFKDP